MMIEHDEAANAELERAVNDARAQMDTATTPIRDAIARFCARNAATPRWHLPPLPGMETKADETRPRYH